MSNWDNGGPDRFTHQNRPAVVDLNAFAWPGGCGNVTTAVNPGGCNFRVGSAGRNITTGPGLMWAQISAQKNFRIDPKAAAGALESAKKIGSEELGDDIATYLSAARQAAACHLARQ